jgi:hypothetical protein
MAAGELMKLCREVRMEIYRMFLPESVMIVAERGTWNPSTNLRFVERFKGNPIMDYQTNTIHFGREWLEKWLEDNPELKKMQVTFILEESL